MRRSLGIMSGAFALRSRAFAPVGHVVFYLFGGPFPCAAARGGFNGHCLRLRFRF
jgi:hypothetical protein